MSTTSLATTSLALPELVGTLDRARIVLRLDGTQLRVSAPKGSMTTELREALTANKTALIEHLRAEEVEAAAPAVLPRDGRGHPLSPAQEGLWLLERMEQVQTYVLCGGLRMRGELDSALLRACLDALLRRHESLRTAVRLGVDGPEQVVLLADTASVREHDLYAAGTGATELDHLVAEFTGATFDLAEGAVFRALLVRVGAAEHYLALAIHHIAADAASLGVLFDELFRLYDADGDTSVLPPLSAQYLDACDWYRRSTSPIVVQRQLDYWRQRLDGAPGLLELPVRARPAAPSSRGAVVRFVIDEPTATRLSMLANEFQVTKYALLLTCWAVLLARHAAAPEVVVGTPVVNRDRPEFARTTGFFVGTVPLRIDLRGGPALRAAAKQVHRTVSEAFENRRVSFRQIVEAVAPHRSSSHTPIFQNMLTYYESARPATPMGGLDVEFEELHNGTAKFDLTLFAEDAGTQIHCQVEYATDLFTGPAAAQLAGSFQCLLAGAVGNPEYTIEELPLLDSAARHELLVTRNATTRAVDADRPIHRLVSDRATTDPDAVAVEFGTDRLTYAQLDTESNRLARYLRDHGAGPNQRVALCAHRSIRQMVATLAIVKSGAALVPLDPEHPPERTAAVLADASCVMLLADTEDVAVFSHNVFASSDNVSASSDTVSTPPPTRSIDIRTTPWSNSSGDPLEIDTTRADLIYVLYTSGSTGVPKGVAMRHGALTNLLAWQTRTYPLGPDDRVLQFSAATFDVSIQEIFTCWAAGARLVLVDAETRRDPFALLPFIAERGITTLFLPYVALRQLTEVAAAQQIWPTALRNVYTAGEQLHVTGELREFFQRTGAALHNQYGPTEAHVVTAYTLPGAPETWEALPPIGRPIDNTRTYVLDRLGQPVPPGAVGELYLGGLCLAQGYLGRADLTEERFIPDPHVAGELMYRTGDSARYRADGELEYVARLDNQVKVRGYRIEPGEIEAVLLTHPEVAQAVVEVRGEGVAARIIAWIVGADAQPPEVLAHCAKRLPEYMLPAAVVPLAKLPMTSAGKVARRELPVPDAAVREPVGRPPSTPVEQSVAAVIADILGVPAVGLDDDFFALGGNSLAATRVAMRLSDRYAVAVSVQAIFGSPRISELAGVVETLLWAAESAPAHDDDRDEGEL